MELSPANIIFLTTIGVALGYLLAHAVLIFLRKYFNFPY